MCLIHLIFFSGHVSCQLKQSFVRGRTKKFEILSEGCPHVSGRDRKLGRFGGVRVV